MRRSNWTPSIVPDGDHQTVYLVMDDLGRLGRIWPEANAQHTDLETVIQDLLEGQYHNPIGIFCFNTAEGWSRDVSTDGPPDAASFLAAICFTCLHVHLADARDFVRSSILPDALHIDAVAV
jgi:hypothetical protein